MPRSPQALLWDMDGVIVNSGPYHYQAYREVLSSLGRDLPEQEYTQNLFGRRNYDILRAVLGDRPDAEIEALARRKEEAFRRLVRGHVQALPGAREMIERAREAGKKQAIVSSTPLENIELVLDALGLRGCFEAIVGEEDVERGKPDPQGFLLAASRLSVPPAACVVLEDAPEGIAAGKRGGMRCIGVATTRPPQRLAEADLVVETLEDERVAEFMFGREGE